MWRRRLWALVGLSILRSTVNAFALQSSSVCNEACRLSKASDATQLARLSRLRCHATVATLGVEEAPMARVNVASNTNNDLTWMSDPTLFQLATSVGKHL
jgi:hypothetical protein